MNYPDVLTPVGAERIVLPTGAVISIPTARPTFVRWTQPDSGGKRGSRGVLLAVDHRPCTAEQAILGILEQNGWRGVRVRAFGECVCTAEGMRTELPREQAAVLAGIYARNSNRNGCFDLFAWKRRDMLFAEARHTGAKRMNALRLRWLDAALRTGMPAEAFLIVEWDCVSASDPRRSPRADTPPRTS